MILDESTGLNAEKVMKLLAAEGVGTRPFFYPMHQQPVLRRLGLFEGEHYPVAERISRQGFYVPSGMALKHEQLDRIANSIRDTLTNFSLKSIK
jgi:perosamine synthetase